MMYVSIAMIVLGLMGLALGLNGCGLARGSNVMAIEIPGPNGVRCFGIYSDGTPIGGNCIPE